MFKSLVTRFHPMKRL